MSGAGWYAVSLSTGIDPGRSAGTQLFDKEIVLWRDADGVAHAWEDRCPHRGMRLSFGFVRGDRLACLYHGWQYDAAGQCRLIPAHPELKVPDSIRVTTYPCQEGLGMVWMRSPAVEAAPAELAIDRRTVTPVRSIHIDCAFSAAIDALAKRGEILDQKIGLMATRVDGLPLIISVQPYGRRRTSLHIVIEGSQEMHRGVAQSAAAEWAEEFRLELESHADSAAESILH